MSHPCPGASITNEYGTPGNYAAGMHTGRDYNDNGGTAIHATRAGRVVAAGYMGDYGNRVEILSGDIEHSYSHLEKILVSSGQQVSEGQQVGVMGSTGNSTGRHLHYEERNPQHGYHDHRSPSFDQSSGGSAGSGWRFPNGHKVFASYLCWQGHEQNPDGKSDSIAAWQEILNRISMPGGQELPITSEWHEMTASETQLHQQTFIPPPDSPLEAVYVGPKQYALAVEQTGCPYVWVDD